jgi:hypothetical protein
MERGITRSALTLVFLLVLAMTAACERAVRPFRPHDKSMENPLLQLSTSAGLAVMPTDGATLAASAPLAKAVAAALGRLDLPASAANSPPGAILVESQASISDESAASSTLRIHWTLSDPKQSVAGTFESEMPINREEWKIGAPSLIEQIADAAARGIATLFQNDQREQIGSQLPQIPVTLAIAGVDGAPGDEGDALLLAFRTVLTQAGIRIVDAPNTASAILRGSVEKTGAGKGRTRLVIVWTLSATNGQTIGTLRQDNTIEKVDLSERWGSLVYDIAFAAADSIAVILEEFDAAAKIDAIGAEKTVK